MRKPFHTPWTLAFAALGLGCLVFATVVHASYGGSVIGIDFVGADSDGMVFAVSNFTESGPGAPPSETYASDSGGLYWMSYLPFDYYNRNYETIRRGESTAITPRGTYSLLPDGIWLTKDGVSELVYPTKFLSDQSSVWIQGIETGRWYGRVITKAPYNMVYDESSGNVIVSMGLLGVLVGAPDGEWLPVRVDHFIPVDFSISNKLDHLVTRHWASFLALSIAVVATASATSNFRRNDVLWAAVATFGAVLVAGALFVILFDPHSLKSRYPVFGAACVLLTGSLAYVALERRAPTKTQLMTSLALAVCGASLALLSLPLYRFTWWGPPFNFGPTLASFQVFAMASAISSATLLRFCQDELTLTRLAAVAVGLAVLAIFIAWLIGAVPLYVAYILAVALALASSIVLSLRLRRNRQIRLS